MATSKLLGGRKQVEADPDPEVLNVDQASDVLDALSSTTARQILLALYDSPGPVSDVADEVDSSIQNVKYHLDSLEGADLVEVTDTWYSSKGIEMDVYAPTSAPLVLFAGESDEEVMTEIVEGDAPSAAPEA